MHRTFLVLGQVSVVFDSVYWWFKDPAVDCVTLARLMVLRRLGRRGGKIVILPVIADF